MTQAGTNAAMTQADIDSLNAEYKNFIERAKRRWLRDNNSRPQHWVLYEIDARERARVDAVIHRWGQYITPLAERWWKRRGFGIRWPEKSTDNCQIFKLEAAAE